MDLDGVDLPDRGRGNGNDDDDSNGEVKEENLSLRITEDLNRRIEDHADERDVTPSEFVRDTLDELLEEDTGDEIVLESDW
jgi:hypothetical protein